MYLLQASTLTKLFLPEWHYKCLENPKLLADPAPFKIHIPRAVGAIELWHNRPVLASSLIAQGGYIDPDTGKMVKKTREVTDDEVTPLVQWLTNVQNSETDQWGVVEIKVEQDLADTIMALIYEGKSDEREKFMLNMKEKMSKAVMEAREVADHRVMRACGKIYNVVKQTVEHMKKNNTGVYSPSYSEALAMSVMKDTISARRKPDEAAANLMRTAMSQMEQPA